VINRRTRLEWLRSLYLNAARREASGKIAGGCKITEPHRQNDRRDGILVEFARAVHAVTFYLARRHYLLPSVSQLTNFPSECSNLVGGVNKE
jgi:hypothetical protein